MEQMEPCFPPSMKTWRPPTTSSSSSSTLGTTQRRGLQASSAKPSTQATLLLAAVGQVGPALGRLLLPVQSWTWRRPRWRARVRGRERWERSATPPWRLLSSPPSPNSRAYPGVRSTWLAYGTCQEGSSSTGGIRSSGFQQVGLHTFDRLHLIQTQLHRIPIPPPTPPICPPPPCSVSQSLRQSNLTLPT